MKPPGLRQDWKGLRTCFYCQHQKSSLVHGTIQMSCSKYDYEVDKQLTCDSFKQFSILENQKPRSERSGQMTL
jgi:hypothetical protein